MFKKLSSILIILALLLSVATGCSGKKDKSSRETRQTRTTATTETGEATKATETSETSETAKPTETSETSQTTETSETSEETSATTSEAIDRDGTYTSKDDVALYLYTYGELPSNFITKKEARDLGWSGGSVEDYAPGMCIGGDHFGNYEGVLPDGNYRECDIDTLGKSSRGAKRIIWSDDGRIYYTDDHYESFTLLYGEE
ncbi:MAG: ribonuclease [Clostridiales bacterium]|nr:ribonuclease [Clostridiales bacterium]